MKTNMTQESREHLHKTEIMEGLGGEISGLNRKIDLVDNKVYWLKQEMNSRFDKVDNIY